MDMNLVLLIFFVETVIFIWLLKEGILAVLNFNIFEYTYEWVQDRPIILPSVLFLTLPFIICLVANSSTLLLEKNANNSSLFTWITTISTVLFTAFGLFFNNRYSEFIKNKKKQKELSNTLIVVIKNQILRIQEIQNFNLNHLGSNYYEIKGIDEFVNVIKNDSFYQNCLSNLGVYEPKIMRLIMQYHQTAILFINEFNRSLKRGDEKPSYICPMFISRYKDLIDIVLFKAYLVLMILNENIINENQEHQEIKTKIVKEYCSICDHENRLKVNNFIVTIDYRESTHSHAIFETKELLEMIIVTFKEMGILSELKNCTVE